MPPEIRLRRHIMVAPSPGSLLRQASGWSIVWGVLLIVFGIRGRRLAASGGRGGQRAHRMAHYSRWRRPPGSGVSRPRRRQHDLESCWWAWPTSSSADILSDASAVGGGVIDAAAGIALLHRGRAGCRALLQASSRAGRGLGAVRRTGDFAAGAVYRHCTGRRVRPGRLARSWA